MSTKRIFLNFALILLIISNFASSFAGEFGEGGGTPRVATLVELKATVGTVQKFIYFEALSLMGDVGEGGGGVRKWQQEFQAKYQRRLKTNSASTDIRLKEGQRFIFIRRKMPAEEFGKLELKSIVGFRTLGHGNLSSSNIYYYHLKDQSSVSFSSDTMSNLLGLETLEGIMIPQESIVEVILEFKANP